MPSIPVSEEAQNIIQDAVNFASMQRHEFLMPEHVLYILTGIPRFADAFDYFAPLEDLRKDLEEFFTGLEKIPEDREYELQESEMMSTYIHQCFAVVSTSSAEEVDLPVLVNGLRLLNSEFSWASQLISDHLGEAEGEFMSRLLENLPPEADIDSPSEGKKEKRGKSGDKKDWKALVTCMNDCYASRNPLIGREDELERTIRVLCRKEKNNPLHVGEPGVGKTALVWGLVRRIEEGNVPERLKGSRVYLMDLSSIIAGTQYRGDFEKRLKQVMEGIKAEGSNNIVYIDEIHTLVGAGATGEGALDASNILKPYLEDGSLRFIGSTTYEEFNRYFSRSKGLVRRFQQIDLDQPSTEEAINIIRQLQPHYETFHGVNYSDEAIRFAVEASARHIPERFLPDKAIDLVDEAGAAMQMAEEKTEIGVKEMAEVLARICRVDALSHAEEDDFRRLENLSGRLLSQIFGQDEAIRQVVESVQMARAGLLDENKPLASLLFVGPTGVGKTEVARMLSKELGVELIRFDMSEYTEKHSVAKLIGSPAGYVGYEDGGLLTDAIRKSPNAVLLLDEIEKAHPDIYNILLQVMDYGRLTDNKGRHADFRNVVLIMTSNAGAQFASQGSLGFAGTTTRGGTMMKQVKKTFKPEFLNRLSGTVVFNDMDREMATLILRKKLGELERKLEAKKVCLTVEPDTFEFLLEEGFTPEYGAREMDRVIRNRINPVLMREILFGRLRKGGSVTLTMQDGMPAIGSVTASCP